MNQLQSITLSLILCAVCSSAQPANSAPLRGYVSHTEAAALTESSSPPNLATKAFEGTWSCVTVVTDSRVTAIYPGQKMVSAVRFNRQSDGQLTAHWEQPGWTETQSSIVTFAGLEGQVDRTNYYFGEGMNGSWAARSRDHLKQIKTNMINVESYVDQYIDGHYLGRYHTKSVLSRIPDQGKVANISE